MDALTDLCRAVGSYWQYVLEAGVHRLPGGAAVLGAKDAGGGDGDPHAVGVYGVEDDRVDDEAAGAGEPAAACVVVVEGVFFEPGLAVVLGTKQAAGIDAAEEDARLRSAPRLEAPEALDAASGVVWELGGELAFAPGLAEVRGAGDVVAEPGAVSRRVEGAGAAVDCGVVDLDAVEEGPGQLPGVARRITAEEKEAFASTDREDD
jgi:hypothetical protein